MNLSSKYTGSSSEIYSIGIFTSPVRLQAKQLVEVFDRIVQVVMLLLPGNVNIGWLLLLKYSLKSDCWRWEKTGKNNCCVENWGCLTLQTSHRPYQWRCRLIFLNSYPNTSNLSAILIILTRVCKSASS